MIDLLERTAELVAVPSVSLDEARLAGRVEAELRAIAGLEVERVGDNVVARTTLDRPLRVVLAGHLDTVPANGNATPRIEDDVLWGLGATDMKGGLAVMLELARSVPTPAVDVTWVFYVGEEIASVHNGLGQLFRDRPDLVSGDVAVLGEPTGGAIEAGCQGSSRVNVILHGQRAHSARPWMGRNAIHRAGRLLEILAAYEPRRPVLDGCEYREAIEAVAIEGGVAGNVVPDLVTVTVNLRVAPDRTSAEAVAGLRDMLGAVLEADDEVQVVDVAEGAAPAMTHPVLAALRDRNDLVVRAKLGWTDVARFAEAGIPAVNFGPGDSELAHSADERVDRASLEATYAALADLLQRGP
ncbi:MAG TPA: succinyl-diaminopimelate desuccinylase [Acidimicrobiales bacterium]